MELLPWLRQALLFVHALSFGIAIAAVLREDLAVLRSRAIDRHRLARTAQLMARALAVLWVTGLALVALELGGDLAALAGRPKLVAKIAVVTALTLNGVLLHRVAFPLLQRRRPLAPSQLLLCSALGVFSTTSWLYAAFVGLSRPVAASMRLADYLSLYGLLLLAAATAVPLLAATLRGEQRPLARLHNHPRAG